MFGGNFQLVAGEAVTPAQAGVQALPIGLDSGLSGNDSGRLSTPAVSHRKGYSILTETEVAVALGREREAFSCAIDRMVIADFARRAEE